MPPLMVARYIAPPHRLALALPHLLLETHMSIKSDRWIRRMALEHGMIEPFEDRQVRTGVISYGVSSYGYDMRVATRVPDLHERARTRSSTRRTSTRNRSSNSRATSASSRRTASRSRRSVEYFRIPRNVITITVGKSTYARCGIITNVTPFEPEWEGFVTLEISNTTPLPARIYANEGIAQVLFFEGDEAPETSYADKKGKYQGQHGVTLPRL